MIRLKTWTIRHGVAWALALAFSASARAEDPPVPPGRDPGGVMVALLAQGFDYTRPEIATRLARDGEGEIVGFDFVDNDRTPYDGRADGDGAAVARIVVEDAPRARLALLRASDPPSIGRSLAFIAQSPARVAFLVGSDVDDEVWRLIERAARRLSDVLFIVGCVATDKPGSVAPGAVPDNLLGLLCVNESPDPPPDAADYRALARDAALAARIIEAEPSLTGAEIKRRVEAQRARSK